MDVEARCLQDPTLITKYRHSLVTKLYLFSNHQRIAIIEHFIN